MKITLKSAAIIAASAGTCLGDVLPANPGPANNGLSAGAAIFFDLEALASPITVTHFSTANTGAANAAFSVEVFVRDGTSLGGPVTAGPGSSTTGWTSLGIVPATQGATANGVSLDIDIPDIIVGAGSVKGVAVKFTTVGPRYFGTGTGAPTVYSDVNLKLTTGDARSAPFTTTGSWFAPRMLVGNITYGIGGTVGACCLPAPSYACVSTTAASCANQGGTYAGDNVTCATANCPPPPTGGCCKTDGTCEVLTQLACQAISGALYSGNNVTCANANCAVGGACCQFSSCSILTSAACVASSGTWQGANSACASCPTPYAEVGDAGDLPGTAQDVTGTGAVVGISGTLTTGDADMYRIRVCDAANFSASTVGITTVDTILAIFRSDGRGVAQNDDVVGGTALQSALTNQFVGPAGNGNYYLTVVQFNKQSTNALGQLWINDNSTGHLYRSERAPDGPGAADPLTGWTVTTGTGGTYGIRLTGACAPTAGCYANCDGSTGSPQLTANDFQCFINKYAANDTYANCDGSTGNPALTANDFQCFINKYAGGCS